VPCGKAFKAAVLLRGQKEVVQRHLTSESKMILARELGPSSDQVVEYWLRKWRKGDDDALKPKSKGRPKGSAKPKMLTEEDKLRRENERLRAENVYLKNCGT
jgi:putative insertion element